MNLSEIVKTHEEVTANNGGLLVDSDGRIAHQHRAALIQMVKDRDALIEMWVEANELLGAIKILMEDSKSLRERLEEI